MTRRSRSGLPPVAALLMLLVAAPASGSTRPAAASRTGAVASRGPSSIFGRGKLDRGQVWAAVDRHLPEIRRCYGAQLSVRPDLRGVVEVRLDIAASGALSRAEIVRNTTNSQPLAACIQSGAARWRLPKPWGGSVRVTYPFTLAPREKDVEPPRPRVGRLASSRIVATVRQRQGEAAKCYERALKRKPSLGGKLKVQFTIAPTGAVSAAKIVSDGLRDAKLSTCVLARLKSWRFPRPVGGPVTARYPFVFSAGGEDPEEARYRRRLVKARLDNAGRGARACLKQRGPAASAVTGEVRVKLNVPALGGKAKVDLLDNGTKSEDARSCALDALRSVRFPQVGQAPESFVYSVRFGG